VVIGTIVKSNSHISYMCRVYGKLEADVLPQPVDYAFARFVSFVPSEGAETRLIGVVHDTILLNPEYGNLGPRLSSSEELAVFSPDYLNEKGVLVDILVLGWIEEGRAYHTVPALAGQIGARVETMGEEEVHNFHRDRRGGFLVGYLPQLMMRNDPIVAGLLLAILERLEPAFPDHRRVISVLKNNLAWKSRVVPAG